MKKYLTLQLTYLLMVVCYAQVGINTENPRGVLDVRNASGENYGMVLPTVERVELVSTPNSSDILNGTIVYDASRDALCVKLMNGWR